MKKSGVRKLSDDLRPEYDFAKMKGGRRGKYLRAARAGSNLILIEPDLAAVFPDADAVNRALRLVVEAAAAVERPARRRAGAKPSRR